MMKIKGPRTEPGGGLASRPRAGEGIHQRRLSGSHPGGREEEEQRVELKVVSRNQSNRPYGMFLGNKGDTGKGPLDSPAWRR